MPRLNRYELLYDNCIVHVRLKINNSEFLFNKHKYYRLWKRWVKVYLGKYPGVKLTGYQWMSNHCHLILEIGQVEEFVKFMHDINWRFAFEYNKMNGRKGHFFQSRYQCSVIEKDAYEAACQRYIYRNQYRAGMVKAIGQTLWGSYDYYAYGQDNTIITPFRNYANFGRCAHARQKEFQLYVETMTLREEQELRSKMRRSRISFSYC